ncbi:MarR family winged helix-turn-helix transcriptional regulator [Filifactor villosus]|uniref:MarR family winged helix-turn-helix transcriptional regulator n=1 Tax=Filifactor villosus TaxID=29374 RepID=A0ABV9QJ81_9FIRM
MSTTEEKLLISISRMRNLLFRDLDTIFSSNGLTTTQFAVLEVLYHKGTLCVGDIQRLILGTSGNIPLVIKNLEKEGLVLRKKSETDRRISMIDLTEKGLLLIKKVYPLQKQRLSELFQDVSNKEKKALTQSLLEVYQIVLSTKEKI